MLTVPFPTVARGEANSAAWRETIRHESPRLAGRFDAALVVRPDDPWSGELVANARIPLRIGFDMPRTRPHLTHALPAPADQHVALDGFDLADALLARLGVAMRTERRLETPFKTSRDDEAEAARVLADAGADAAPVVLHPGSGWPLKNWPAARWRELASVLARDMCTRPVVAGAPSEASLVAEVVAGAPALDIAGRLSLGGLAAVHRRARLVVTTDSGALHIAAAVGAPVVALFGPGDPFLFAPLADPDRVRVVRTGIACSPCGTLEHPPCGADVDPACVVGITVADVANACAELLRTT